MFQEHSHPDVDAAGFAEWTVPTSLRLLVVGPDEPTWAGLALRLDAFGCETPRFRWEPTGRSAIAALRHEPFDGILVGPHPEPGESLDIVDGLRAAAQDEPVVVVSPTAIDDLWIEAGPLDCEIVIAATPWSSPAVLATLMRALERHARDHELRRLRLETRRRVERDRLEAERMLGHQRRIIEQLDGTAAFEENPSSEATDLRSGPVRADVDRFYDELLRTHVIMGSGQLSTEIAHLSELLAVAGIGPRQALELHVERVQRLVRGLGNRSTRHVMDRADLLALELVVQLGELFRHTTGIERAA